MSKLQQIADKYGLDISKYDPKQLVKGMKVEKEHDDGSEIDVVTNVGDLMKIAMAHLDELPDYYDRLEKMENESINESPANIKSSGKLSKAIYSALIKNGIDDSQVVKVLANTIAGLAISAQTANKLNKLVLNMTLLHGKG